MERDNCLRVSVEPIAPLLYRQSVCGTAKLNANGAGWMPVEERYYFWWCGFVAKLPVTTTRVVKVTLQMRH